MKDSRLEAYADAVESSFFRWRERPGTLSPEDFARVRRWYLAGVPVEVVLEGIAEAFRSHRAGREGAVEDVNGLAYCEPFVDRALRRRRGRA